MKLQGSYNFIDGARRKISTPLPVQKIIKARAYLDFNKGKYAQAVCNNVCEIAHFSFEKLQSAFDWVTSNIAETDFALHFELIDTNQFSAQCEKTGDFPNRACVVSVSLGCVPSLVGITNRMLHLQKSGPMMLAMQLQGDGPLEKWDPMDEPVGITVYDYGNELNTCESTADAMVLMLFHEVSHALRGHPWIGGASGFDEEIHRRALESDADWYAGYLFTKYELKKLEAKLSSCADDFRQIALRLAVSTATLNFALQLHSDKSLPIYHLPYVRTLDNLYGAEAAWVEEKTPGDFRDLMNSAYDTLSLTDRIVSYALPQWIRRDAPESIIDEKERLQITEPALRSLYAEVSAMERGPVKRVHAKDYSQQAAWNSKVLLAQYRVSISMSPIPF